MTSSRLARAPAVRVAFLALLLLLLCCLSTFAVTTAAAAAAAPSTKQLQRQRLKALTKYAERVGAALEVLTSGAPPTPFDTSAEASGGTNDEDATSSVKVQPAPLSGGIDAVASLARYMQYPHTAVQAAVQAAAQKASAVRTVASVVAGASLSEKEEAQLAQVQARGEHTASLTNTEADTVAAAAARAIRREVLARSQKAAPRQAQAQTLADGDGGGSDGFAPYIRCENGFVALASNIPMDCAASGRTTVGDYESIPEADRPTCRIAYSTPWLMEQQCVCAVDALIVQTDMRAFQCATRPIDVQILFDDAYLCHSAADAALGLPSTMESEYCIKTTRNAVLNLPVRWRYTYLTTDALLAAVETTTAFVTPKDVPENAEDLQWVVMGASPPTGYLTSTNVVPYAKGSYNELNKNTALFTFLTPPTAESEAEAAATGVEAFYVSSNSSLHDAHAFSAIFSFGAPRKTRDHLNQTYLQSTKHLRNYFGNVNGTSSQTLTLDLSNVTDEFVEGNQMYVEYGIHGGSTAYTYRVSRLHISFSDLAVPSDKTRKYKKQFNPLYILLIVAIGVVAVGAGLAVLWYHLMAREEYDDNLVTDAQRKKAQRQAAGS